jgi:hypothetical protein
MTISLRAGTSSDGYIQVDGTDKALINATGLDSGINITASVAANALTITLNPCSLRFRSATLGSGTVNARIIPAAISVVISSGSTLGTINATQNRLAVLAIDNAGTVELAVVNISGGNDLSETGLISTTAEGGAGAADSASTIYSTTARSNVPYRVVGFVESTQATAGTWATAPSTIQGYGGQAFAAMSSLGYGSYADVVGSRAFTTTFYNTSGRPRIVSIRVTATAVAVSLQASINGAAVYYGPNGGNTTNAAVGAFFIVPPGQSYAVTLVAGTATINSWHESN